MIPPMFLSFVRNVVKEFIIFGGHAKKSLHAFSCPFFSKFTYLIDLGMKTNHCSTFELIIQNIPYYRSVNVCRRRQTSLVVQTTKRQYSFCFYRIICDMPLTKVKEVYQIVIADIYFYIVYDRLNLQCQCRASRAST